MSENTKADSGGARYIAEQFVKQMKELMDERFDEVKRLRDVTIPDVERDIKELGKKVEAMQSSIANLLGRLAIIAFIAAVLATALVNYLFQTLKK